MGAEAVAMGAETPVGDSISVEWAARAAASREVEDPAAASNTGIDRGKVHPRVMVK